MSCSDWAEYADAWAANAFRDAILCPYQDNLSGPLFTLMIWGTITTALYIRTGSVLPPLVLTVVVGGSVMSFMAAPFVGILTAVLLLITGLAPVILIKKLASR